MKSSTLKAEITVPVNIKKMALVMAILEDTYGDERERLIRNLVRYYGVTI